jgi:ribulose-phosphate 3-epimerase
MPWDDWIRTVEVEPSLYAADFARLGEQIETLMRAGVRIFHFDIGDGHFVDPITIGPIVLESISEQVHDQGGVLDCHLMTEKPEKHFRAIAAAGGDSVTVHYEACSDLPAVFGAAREQELQVGLAFKPQTEVVDVVPWADDVDLVLCMSIEPGYSGQPFMPEAFDRIRRLRDLLPPEKHVQVDGGVGAENVREVNAAGADLLVAGSAIFAREDLPRAYRRLIQALP